MKTGKVVFNENNDGALIFYYDDKKHNGQVTSLETDTFDYTLGSVWNAYSYDTNYKLGDGYIRSITIDSSMANYKPKSCAGWFTTNSRIKEIQGLEFLDTSECVSFNRMFAECKSLRNLDLSHFDTSKCENFAGMFQDCENLKIIGGLNNFNVANAKDMSFMFANSDIRRINIKDWDTSNVEDMFAMFGGCFNLQQVQGIENFNTSKVKSFSAMFENCQYLSHLDLSNFTSPNLRDCYSMFKGCKYLRSVDLSGFKVKYNHLDNGKVIAPQLSDISTMFVGCAILSDIKLSKNFLTYLHLSDTYKRSGINPGCKVKSVKPFHTKSRNIGSQCRQAAEKLTPDKSSDTEKESFSHIQRA